MEPNALRIGALARRTGVTTDTIRYYERRGLLRPEGRSPSKYRYYGIDSVRRLRFIRRARELGFPLDQVGSLVGLSSRRGASCASARKEAEIRLGEVELRLARLQSVRDSLRELIRACDSGSDRGDCPLLTALAGEEDDPAPANRTSGGRGERR